MELYNRLSKFSLSRNDKYNHISNGQYVPQRTDQQKRKEKVLQHVIAEYTKDPPGNLTAMEVRKALVSLW